MFRQDQRRLWRVGTSAKLPAQANHTSLSRTTESAFYSLKSYSLGHKNRTRRGVNWAQQVALNKGLGSGCSASHASQAHELNNVNKMRKRDIGFDDKCKLHSTYHCRHVGTTSSHSQPHNHVKEFQEISALSATTIFQSNKKKFFLYRPKNCP